MLVAVTVNTSCFGTAGITSVEERYAAETLLEALRHNAIVLTAETDFPGVLLANVAALPVKLGQQLSIQAAEFKKIAQRSVRIGSPNPGATSIQELVVAARRGADAVICCSVQEASAVRAALGAGPVEICVLVDYPHTRTEALRRSFLEAVELHTLATADCDSIISRAVCGGGKLIIADRMLGSAAKDGIVTGKLEKFARGVVYVAKNAVGPYAPAKVDLEVISVGGGTGARSGFVDPAKARSAISKAIQGIPSSKVIANLQITLKVEDDPPVFQDRLLACGGRCWGIRHGIDSIGALALPPNKRSPTYIDPDSLANRRLLSTILNLKNA